MSYLLYLIPTDAIQTIFLVLVMGLSISSAFWVKLTAKPENWTKAWEMGTPNNKNDDLNSSHGSIYELHEAIAMPAEKFADVLPSMLLVIGLLGTFLGVGVALNAAADVLGESSKDPVELLGKMMPMLDGLGALFKSSIYGIIFFFLFTIWRSKFGSEKNRFKWCVELVNSELKAKSDKEDERAGRIIAALNSVRDSLGTNIKTALEGALLNGFTNVHKSLLQMNRNLGETLQATVEKGFENIGISMKSLMDTSTKLVDKQKTMIAAMQNVSSSLEGLSQNVHDTFENMSEKFVFISNAAIKMGESANNMGKASDKLSKSVNDFAPQVKTALDSIQTNFVRSIEASSNVMKDAGTSIREAVDVMAEKSAQGQAKLNETLTEFDRRIGVSLNDIREVSTNSQKMMGKTEDALRALNAEIEKNMEAISLENRAISSALRKLPENIAGELQKYAGIHDNQATDMSDKVKA